MSATSPTLTLKVDAPQALGAFEELRRSIAAVKAELATLGKGGASNTGAAFVRLQAEVNELKSALAATRLENERLAKTFEANAAKEIAATKEVTRAKKAAADEAQVIAKRQQQAVEASIAAELAAQERRNERLLSMQMRNRLTEQAQRDTFDRTQRARVEQVLARNEALNAAARLRNLKDDEAAEARRIALQVRSAQMKEQMRERARVAVETDLVRQINAQERLREAQLLAEQKRLAREVAAREAAEAAKTAAIARAVARNNALNDAARRRNAAAPGGAGGGSGAGRSFFRGATYGAGGGAFLSYGASIPALAAGFAVAATTADAVSEGAQFQYQTAVAGALGDYNPEQLASMREELRKLGTDAVFGPNELAKALAALEASGVHANDALRVLPVSMKIAQQGEVDLQDASKTLIGVMNQFGMGTTEINKIGDAMSKTAAVTQASMPTLMEALKQMTGLQRYGVDLNSALALVGILAKQGITGPSAGTFSRRFIEEMYDPRSMDAMRVMRQLNFNPYNQDGTRRNYREVQAELVNSLQGYDEISRNKMMGQLFDVRSLKSVSALVTDLKNTFGTLRDEIDKSKGSLEAFSEALSGETKTLWSQVKSNFEGLMIDTFKSIEGPLNGLLMSMKDFFKDESTKNFLHLVAMIPAGYAKIAALALSGGRGDAERALDLKAQIDEFQHNFPKATVGGKDFRSRRLTALTNAYNTLFDKVNAGAVAADVSRMSSATPMFGFDENVLAQTQGKQRAPLRFTNKLKFTEEQALASAMAAEATAGGRRELQRINDEANKEQQLLEAKHRFGLVSEAAYTKGVEELNDRRRQAAIEEANNELQILHDSHQVKETEADKQRIDTRIKDLQNKRDGLLREAQYQKDLLKVQREGAEKQAAVETEKLLRKHLEQGAKYREGLRLQLEAGLRPAVVAAQFQAEFQTRESFNTDIRNVDAEIAAKAKDGNDNTGVIKQLRARREELIRLRDEQARVNGEAARAAKEAERAYRYGRDQLFVQYVDAATNAAENARRAWGTALTGLENQLTSFIMKGKADWRSFGNSIVEELVRIQIRKAMAGVLNLFIPGADTSGAAYDAQGAATVADVTAAFQQHTGGIVGRDASGLSLVHPSVFNGAPRFHTSGLVGDEVPIIAKKGEGVFTPDQMRMLAPAVPPKIKVEMVNQGTPQKVTEVQPRMDVDQLVLRVITRDIDTNGPASQRMAQRFGLSRQGTV